MPGVSTNFVLTILYKHHIILNKKNMIQRNWDGMSPNKRQEKLAIDQATLLGGLGILIIAYIAFRFVYPLIEKGVLW